jgi:uncharacterized membrane protein
MTLAMPPFQNPDEPAHFRRAEHISRGHLIGNRYAEYNSGGETDANIGAANAPFYPIPFHSHVKATREMFAQADLVHWGGPTVEQHFPNTAIYPPFLYLPAVAGIWIGKAVDWPITDTLYLSRLLTGLCSLALAAVALALAGNAAPWLFSVLTLPMSLSLMAAVSQDGPMLGLAALAAAICLRMVRDGAPPFRHALAVLTVALMLIGMARPPYAALALLPLALPGTRPAARWLCAALVLGAVIAWSGLAAMVAQVIMVRTGTMPDPALQIRFLLDDPIRIVSVAARTIAVMGGSYVIQFIGQLGWLDLALPRWFHGAAGIILLAALLGSMSGPRFQAPQSQTPHWGWIMVVASALAVSVVAMFAIQYLTWTKVGLDVVEGMQGRYFLVPALVFGALLPAGAMRGVWTSTVDSVTLALLAAFPAVTLPVLVWQLLLRYYFQP